MIFLKIRYLLAVMERYAVLVTLVVKRRQSRGGWGQKSPIFRRHSLWTAPKHEIVKINESLTYLRRNNELKGCSALLRFSMFLEHKTAR